MELFIYAIFTSDLNIPLKIRFSDNRSIRPFDFEFITDDHPLD